MFTLEGFPEMLVCVYTMTQHHILEDSDILHILFRQHRQSLENQSVPLC